ncbi:MAG: hydroxylamine reductase, partial [Deltaproteobacteria bacterium]|nr:hydroxylamine reductase [Deltaproteobacteria bacterium]
MSSMFCNQCQEALNNYACEKSGVCGREPVLSNLMDILVSVCKGVSYLAQKVEKDRYEKKKADVFLLDSLFSTITNVNFDEDEIFKKIENGIILMEDLRKYLKVEWSSKLPPECLIEFHRDKSKMISEHNTLKSRIENEDIKSLKDIILYGLKGMAAYAYHSYILGKYDYELMGFMHSVMSSLLTENDLNNLLSLVMKTGEYGVRVMQMLDSANTERFGHPVPTDVYTGTKKGP